MKAEYVHGYGERESERLQDQADTLRQLLHHDTRYKPGETVLEIGCGTGAQTVALLANSPDTQFVCADLSETSLRQASQRVATAGLRNVEFKRADVFDLPWTDATFDHVFVCFMLEHLAAPGDALAHLKRVLKRGGTLTTIEGDHGSAYFYPRSEFADRAINCQVTLQAEAGGNALIGRELYPLLCSAGFEAVSVSPRMVYADGSRPDLIDGFTRRTFTAMIEGVREDALTAGLINEGDFDRGIRDLYRSAEPDGVFCYTFFKGLARNPS